MTEPRTYGEISQKAATLAMREMLDQVRFGPNAFTKPTRWQRFKRWFNIREWRWRISDALNSLAGWIEP